MSDNIIYFSGTHGVGKTTTIRFLHNSKSYDFVNFDEENLDHQNPFRNNVYKRQEWRLKKYASVAKEILKIKNKLKEKIKFY